MPIARIRTNDPESISFLAAKLADSGFQVQFAVPGDRLSDDVDLDITVTRSKSPKTPDEGIVASSSQEGGGAWTTPYHVEAPEISEAGEPGDECTNLDIPWNDRELARILATGSNRAQAQSGEVEEQLTTKIACAEVGVSAVLRIVEDTEPAIATQQPMRCSRPNRGLQIAAQAQRPSRHSFRQRFATIAAIVTLAVTAVFSLTLSGDRPYPSKETEIAAAQPKTELPAPTPTVAVPTLRVAATDLVTVASPVSSEPTLTKSDVPEPRVGHTKHHIRRASRTRRLHRPVEDPEVIVRHFPATAGQ